MKNSLIKIITVIMLLQLFGCTYKHTLVIHVDTEPLAEDENVYIAGNQKSLGNWHPGSIRLNKHSATEWQYSIKVPEDSTIEFKFTLGSWAREALNDSLQNRSNYRLKVQRDTTLNFTIKHWKNESNLQASIKGNVQYHRNLSWPGLLNRDVIVWLPPEYDAQGQQRYPVLYMHDGQNVLNAITSSFGNEWRVDETADSLIRKGSITPFIIVGIYNTAERNDEYGYGEMGHRYMDFIVNALKPFIDSTYQTKSARAFTATAGSSMGGLISMALLWEQSSHFSMAACLSPAFKISSLDYVSFIEKTDLTYPSTLYLDNGGIGLERQLQRALMRCWVC